MHTWRSQTIEATFQAHDVVPRVYLLTVDDTAAGAALRDQLRGALKKTLRASFDAGRPLDPSWWREEDVSLILVLPSATGEARYVGPNVVPALRYRTRHATDEGFDAMVDAAMNELQARGAAPGARYTPLEATHDLLTLLAGHRGPANVSEQALIDSLAVPRLPPTRGRAYFAALVSSVDDASPLSVDAYVLPSTEDLWVVQTNAVYAPSPPCEASEPPTGRIDGWLAEVRWRDPDLRCPAADLDHDLLFEPVWNEEVYGACGSEPIVVDASGSARCRAYALSFEDAACDADRGYFDPADASGVAAATYTTRPGGFDTLRYRVCELRQLEGDALTACRTDPDCTDCPSGFCVAPGLLEPGACPGRHDLGIRFTGGAVSDVAARIEVTCAQDDDVPLDSL